MAMELNISVVWIGFSELGVAYSICIDPSPLLLFHAHGVSWPSWGFCSK